MQFSDTTNINGIIQVAESLTKLGNTGISGDATLLKQFTNYVNQAYSDVVSNIMSVDSLWKWDDANYTDFPEAPITIVSSQRDYTLPVATSGANVATLLRINRVWVLDTNGNRVELRLMAPEENFTYASTNVTATGFPTAYKLQGKSIYLDVLPTATFVTLASGLIIQFQRIPDAFTSADTTQQPGFMEPFHDLLPLKASAWYLLPIDPQLAQLYEQRYEKGLIDLKRDYARMNDDVGREISAEYIRFR
jgi:hypothetical protein